MANDTNLPARPADVTTWTEEVIQHLIKIDPVFATRTLLAVYLTGEPGSAFVPADAPYAKYVARWVIAGGKKQGKLARTVGGQDLGKLQHILPKYSALILEKALKGAAAKAAAKEQIAEAMLGPKDISVADHNAKMLALSKASCEDAG